MKRKSGQAIIELTFSVIILMVMIYGLAHIFQWVGYDTARRQQEHDILMTRNETISESYDEARDSGVVQQLEPEFYDVSKMNAIYEDAL